MRFKVYRVIGSVLTIVYRVGLNMADACEDNEGLGSAKQVRCEVIGR